MADIGILSRKLMMNRSGSGIISGGPSTIAAVKSSSITYLFSEDFDGAALCATGYSSTCTNTWTVSTGTPDFDYATSPAPIEGTYSLRLDGSSADTTVYIAFTPTAGQAQELYFKINIGTSPLTGSHGLATLREGTTARASLGITSSRTLTIVASGGSTGTTVGTMSASTTYHVWVRYMPGTPAFASVGFSTDGIRPTSGNYYAESPDGTGLNDTNRVYLTGDYTAVNNYIDAVFDHVRIDDTTIGNSPS